MVRAAKATVDSNGVLSAEGDIHPRLEEVRSLTFERLDKAEQAECKAALENLDIPTTTLTDAMNTAYDGKLRKATVGRHRRGDCKCA